MTPANTTTTRILAAALLGACAAALASCNIVTPVAYALEGPGQIEAEYTLPDRKTVVFVDDPNTILPRSALRATLGDAVSFDLMSRELLTSTVSTRDAIAIARAASGGDANNLSSNESIARALDCTQIIHIQPVIFDLAGRSDIEGIKPTASVRVKVIDLEARARTYPSAELMPDGREVTASIREKDSQGLRTRAGRAQIEDELVAELGREVAQLFYKHDRIDLGKNLGTRRK